jgi:aldehyde dehydrogenase (NAD+)/retinal dehydrogenase
VYPLHLEYELIVPDYAGWIDKFAGQSFPADDGFYKIVRYEPLGVVAGFVI